MNEKLKDLMSNLNEVMNDVELLEDKDMLEEAFYIVDKISDELRLEIFKF